MYGIEDPSMDRCGSSVWRIPYELLVRMVEIDTTVILAATQVGPYVPLVTATLADMADLGGPPPTGKGLSPNY